MSLWLTDMADVLRAAGLKVVEEPGWKTRGCKVRTSTPDGGLIGITGGLVHHTATPSWYAGDYPTKRVILEGRPDVPPPLSQLGLGRSGTWYVFAAGRANHSGAVDDVRYSNPQCIGVEAEHPGGSTPWPQVQYDSYVRGCAALGLRYKIKWRAHKEAAVPYGRKPDPNFDMDVFRAKVAAAQARLAGTGGIGGGMSPIGIVPTYSPPYIKEIQTLLNEWGESLVIDGDLGPLTIAAVWRFQESAGLVVDGDPGPITLAALRTATKEDTMAWLVKDPARDEVYMTDGATKWHVPSPAALAALQKVTGLKVSDMPKAVIDLIPVLPTPLSAEQVRAAVADAVAGISAEVDEAEIVSGITAALVEGLTITGTIGKA